MKILVPIDGSRHSQDGLRVAAHFAKTVQAEITVMTVTPEVSDLDLEISASDRDRMLQSMKRRAEGFLAKAVESLRTLGVAAAESLMESAAAPAAAILSAAEKGKFDLIIIGSRGRSAASRFLLGGTAANVVRHSHCCVHVVKDPRWI